MCPPSCRITGSFTVAQPLAPNVNCPGITDCGHINPTSFSFTDGSVVLTQDNSENTEFFLQTDATGSITNWFIAADANIVNNELNVRLSLTTTQTADVVGLPQAGPGSLAEILGAPGIWSVQSTPVGTPVTTATAAVVEASANGDTVANLRGLAPSEAPTLQDQIAMIVQFRTIQNPLISGPDLTRQLVNGLLNDGVVTTQHAQAIETAVAQQIVKPIGPPAISGTTSPTVTPSANVEVDVALTDTGTGIAVNTTVDQITLKTVIGSGSVTLNSPALPITIGNLAVGASSTVKLFLNVPSTVKRFTITETGTVQDAFNRPFNYSTSQTVF